MRSRRLRATGLPATFAVAAVAAILIFDTPRTSVLLALVAVVLFGQSLARAGRKKDEDFSDHAISTLVFPPESKLPNSVFPPR